MQKAKKSIVIFVLAAFAVSMFAGCAKKETESADGTSSGDNDAKPKLKALVGYKSGMDFNNYPVQKFLEEKTGYKVQYDVLPQDKPMDKLNVIISSQQEYDFIIMYDKQYYSQYAQQGALTDLEPLIQKYGPNISKNLDSETFDSIRVNGKIYCVPSNSPSGSDKYTNVNTSVYVRKDWMDKLGIQIPKTVDEFKDMLQQFKDKDPNGNGAKNIPFTVGQDVGLGLCDSGFGGAFGIPTGWVDVDGKLVPRVLMSGFKDYILYMKDLYNKGLLDKETPANQGSTAREKYTSGRAGAAIFGYYDIPQLADTMNKTQPNAKMEFLPPLSGNGGKAAFPAGDKKYATDTITLVPKVSKHAVDVIKYINLKLDEDTFKEMVIGKENVDYTVKSDGYYPILPTFFDDRGNANCYLTGTTKKYGEYWLARSRKDERQYKGWLQLNKDFAQYIAVDPLSRAPILEKNSKYSASLGKLTNDFVIKSIASDFSDATLNNFLAQWKSQGGDEVIKEVNDWYSKSAK
ncbi:MAG: extracellular solute-binding protein [Clostridiales bacterium]|nr:extracellular solute-binding protein [Clostridiales bacterium]